MGLKGAGAERLVLPALQPDDGDARATPRRTRSRSLGADGASRQLRVGQEFYPHRFSASGTATRPGGVRRLRHQRAASRLRRLQRRREGQDRPRARSRAGRARSRTARSTASSPPSRRPRGARRWRRRTRARSRCCSSATCTIIRARRTSRRRRATTGRRSRRASSTTRWRRGPIASAFRSRRSRRRSPRRWSAGTGKTLEELAKASETAHGFTPLRAAGRARRRCTPRSTATSCRIATSSRCSRAAIRG